MEDNELEDVKKQFRSVLANATLCNIELLMLYSQIYEKCEDKKTLATIGNCGAKAADAYLEMLTALATLGQEVPIDRNEDSDNVVNFKPRPKH
jgi:hypothetical protein